MTQRDSAGSDPRQVDQLLESCLAGDPDAAITPSLVYTWVQSPFSAWCELHGPDEERDPVDHFRRVLFEQGRTHERSLVRDLYPDAERVSVETADGEAAPASPEEGFRQVLDFMAAGGRAFHGAPLFYLPEGLWGEMDLIERVDAQVDEEVSVFGPYHYVVKEVKSAKNLRDHHRLQAAVANHLLGLIQGYTPPRFYILDRDRNEVAFDHDEEEVRAVLDGLRKLQEARELRDLQALRDLPGGATATPAYRGGTWPWESYANRLAEESRDVSLVHGVGGDVRDGLVDAGIRTVGELAAADPDALARIHGIGPRTAARIHNAARALHGGKVIRIGEIDLPESAIESPTEVFLDLEGTAGQALDGEHIDMDYLIGALLRRDGEEAFHAFVAHGIDREGEMFREFVEWWSALEDPVVYHWHAYERRALGTMAERHGLDGRTRDRILRSLVDLHRVTTKAFVFPTYGNSIKQIAPFMGYEWQHDDVSATESIAMYFEYPSHVFLTAYLNSRDGGMTA